MECFFKGINKWNCVSALRCDGIYNLALKIGRNKKFAQDYSKNILGLTILHKLRDKYRDIKSKSFRSFIKKKLIKIAYYMCSIIFKDTFHLENSLNRIESKIEEMEKDSDLSDPMNYYKKVGEAYGLIFQNATLGANVSDSDKKVLKSIGNTIGASVALRDSVIDLEDDLKKQNFNPFKGWKQDEIISFCTKQMERLKSDFEAHTKIMSQDKSPRKILKSAVISAISPAILTVPKTPLANLMQGDGCCDACSDCGACCTSCENCDCGGCPVPFPVIIVFVVIAIIIIILLSVLCAVSGRRRGGGGGSCDCSGCDCSGCDCSGCDCG
ncbi:MAG: DUF5685 family protein [Candidatus Hermodarchaeota archaeon]